MSELCSRFYFFEILAFNAFFLEKCSHCKWQCLIQCISCNVVNCNHKYYTMLLSASFKSDCLTQCISYTVVNCIYKYYTMLPPPLSTLSIKLYNVAKNSTSYTTKVTERMSACILRPVVLQLTLLSFSPSICLFFCLSLYLSYLSLSTSILSFVSLSLSCFSLLDCHSICHESL